VLQRLVDVYDDEANSVTETRYDGDGKRKPGKIISHYDNNNLVTQDWYDSHGKNFLTFNYTYLDGKRQTETQSSYGKVFKKETYKYDKRGNIKETRVYEKAGDDGDLKLREISVTDYKYGTS
jgi:hypothetical protein